MKKVAYENAYKALKGKLRNRALNTSKIKFGGVAGKDVYNITAPFISSGKTIIAGRVESRDSEHSIITFFEEKGGTWLPIADANTFNMQDPFFTRIHGELILGGVEISPSPCGTPGKLTWKTIFYRGESIYDLKRFFQGPEHMKDIRLVELSDQRIGVFTRPQGEKGGRGKIGYTEVNSLVELSEEVINEATLFNQFNDDEWGGANEIHLLKNGKLGVLAHIACFTENMTYRHYAAAAFVYDPVTKEYSELEMIASRDLFSSGEAKRSDLEDVVFSGGLKRQGNGKATLYCGIGDAEAHWLEIDDPFCKFEAPKVKAPELASLSC
ncbi:MAG: DUF1861 family protein [Lentisphaerales bacterium]|nr:DUF1861 family protein [Lentisphaerales bacterium]